MHAVSCLTLMMPLQLLQEELSGGVHALSLVTQTPSEDKK